MAKKKSGHIAVPFLVTIFVGLIIIGGFAAGLYFYFGFGRVEAPPEPTPRTSNQITYEDNHTILFVLDEQGMDSSCTFLLMRSIPVKKQIVFIGIPSNSIALVDGEQHGIKNSFERGGAASAAKFVEDVFDIEVDRYMKFDSASFRRICDIFGGVTYPVNADIVGFKNDGSQQYLNSDQMETFVTYSMFSDGEIERAFIGASVIAAMVNQADGKRIADSFDSNFNTIINMVDSDVTAVDYKNHKTAIKNMFENGSSIAITLSLDGAPAGDDFIPSDSFISSVRDQYFKN